MIENRQQSLVVLADGDASNIKEIEKLSVRSWLNLCKFRAERTNPRYGKEG